MRCMEVWGGNQPTNSHFEMPGLELRVYSRPHAGADRGGDVYYVSSCASGRISRMLVADVSGHGDSVGELGIGLRDLMRRNINVIDQSQFVEALNEAYAAWTETHFATAVVMTYFSPRQSLTISSAGHPSPLIYRAATGKWQVFEDSEKRRPRRGLPLGVSEDAPFGQVATRLEQGDTLLCYTDSLSEARDREGNMLGPHGVCERAQSIGSGENVVAELMDSIAELDPSNLLDDDVTVLLCRANGSGVPVMNNVFAPFRLLGAIASRITASGR
ncbi:Phosphoserine phosphatase RsbU [Maioricimonas rarisocia]|uniref:Phosphoserine phosphatase RsbU n=1 Tax=Maioricimonas rarisocia TaxID=2528026 RepID=A0A517Z9W3_9PLAN|nr:PP2C family protein-serine/threonine phosphatase [Maioricimonas rarisocia]QDU39276.1 Phosphoserine phosphatase RsbU [Maioricimonas rarisocia]